MQPPSAKRAVIYYPRVEVPEVTPETRIGDASDPRGRIESKRAVIASSPNPKSTEQLISLPLPKMEAPKDIPVPDLVSQINVQLPSPPAPPKQQPQAPKTYVPPPPVARPQLAMQLPTEALPSPVERGLPIAPNSSALAAIPVAASVPIGLTQQSGSGRVDTAVANLRPVDQPKPDLLAGSRAGEFSKAPLQGIPASGNANGSAVTVRDLSVHKEKTNPAEASGSARLVPILYTDRVRSISMPTLSVPLRPSSRTIPRALEPRFQGRNVYTMVIPIENLSAYDGDWIVWFAERENKPGEAPVMRAPVPFRKLEAPTQTNVASAPGRRVQIAANIGSDGKVTILGVLTPVAAEFQEAAAHDLTSWQFKPATRGGLPIEVEVVIEIPFSRPPMLSRSDPAASR